MVTIGICIAITAITKDQASDVYARSVEMLSSAKTVVGTFTQRTPGTKGVATGDFNLKKNSMFAIHTKLSSELCDGVTRTSIDHKKKTFSIRDVRVYELPYVPGFEGFVINNGKPLVEKFKADAGSEPQPQNLRMARLDGRPAVSYSVGGSNIYLDPNSALPVGADFTGENNQRVTMRFSNIRMNSELNDDMFRIADSRDYNEVRIIDRGMLKAGERLPVSNSVAISMLEKTMAGKKNSVILFFDDKNAPCGEMLQKMFEISKHMPKDVAVIGVARTKNWRKMFTGRLNFTVVEDADLANESISAQFGITRYPTLYILNSNREATYVQIGKNDAELNPLLRDLGFSIR